MGKVEPSKLFERRFHQILDLTFIGNIAMPEHRLAALLLDQRYGFLALVVLEIGNDDTGARCCEGERGGAADAAACSGHDGHFVVKCIFHEDTLICVIVCACYNAFR